MRQDTGPRAGIRKKAKSDHEQAIGLGLGLGVK
jgi:hypothetical protein